MPREFSTDEKTEISHAFDAGNYANAYESDDLEQFEDKLESMPKHERVAFVLGFFSSYELSEMPEYYREMFNEAYASEVGTYVVHVAKYCDAREDEYYKLGMQAE